MSRGYLSKVNKFHQFLMYRNVATEMSRDRNGQTELTRPNRPDWTAQTEMAQTEMAQTETARPNRPDRKVVYPFMDVIFSIWIFFSNIIQKSDCYWVLAKVCTASMLSKSEKILMTLNSRKKPFCQLATAEILPNETGKQQKNDKSAFRSDALD